MCRLSCKTLDPLLHERAESASGACGLQTLQSWVTLAWEQEEKKKEVKKKLFPQVVYWQIQFPDQRWMASVVCASIESRFSSAMCIRYSFYDGYERRACLRDHFSMNFWSVPFSVNNLNPASKGTKQCEEEREREGERADENKGKEEVELLF